MKEKVSIDRLVDSGKLKSEILAEYVPKYSWVFIREGQPREAVKWFFI